MVSLDELCCSHPPSLVCFFWGVPFSHTLQCQVWPLSHSGRHPENWLSGIPSVNFAVQAAETSEVVASFADAFTSVSALPKPAVTGDLTAAAEFVLCVFYPFNDTALVTCSLTLCVDCEPKARISSVFFSWLLGLLGFSGFVVLSHVAVLVFSSLLHFGCFEGCTSKVLHVPATWILEGDKDATFSQRGNSRSTHWIRLGDDFWCTMRCSSLDSCTSVSSHIFHFSTWKWTSDPDEALGIRTCLLVCCSRS